jgi:hypothetical protein
MGKIRAQSRGNYLQTTFSRVAYALGRWREREQYAMDIRGRRIHIAGSAAMGTAPESLRYGHDLIATLIRSLCREGARFLLNVGKEPLAQSDDASSALIFDWTAVDVLATELADGRVQPKNDYGRLVTVVAKTKTEGQIPASRRELWERLNHDDAMQHVYLDPGWAAGAVQRARQAQLGDVLIALSGGEGVEHLAQLYVAAGKPVIPFDLDLGSTAGDGTGGAVRLSQIALAHPERFVRTTDSEASAGLIAALSTRGGQAPVESVVTAVVALMRALEPPRAFYVRLLDEKADEYQDVERYFRDVVDPVVQEFGYTPTEMGRGANSFAWMNQAIFDSLHYSALVIADLTGLRPNCFMELGYALGHAQRVLVTAREGTKVPFDAQMFEYRSWNLAAGNAHRIVDFKEYWERNIDRPPLVTPRELT